MTNYYKKGITALELLLVVAVLGAVFSIVIPQFSKIRELQTLKSGAAVTLIAHAEQSFFMNRLTTRLRIVDALPADYDLC